MIAQSVFETNPIHTLAKHVNRPRVTIGFLFSFLLRTQLSHDTHKYKKRILPRPAFTYSNNSIIYYYLTCFSYIFCFYFIIIYFSSYENLDFNLHTKMLAYVMTLDLLWVFVVSFFYLWYILYHFYFIRIHANRYIIKYVK